MTLADELTREGARDAALGELARTAYDDARPPLLVRAVQRVLTELGELLDGATARFTDSRTAAVVLVLLLAALAALVLVRLGPLGRRHRPGTALFGDGRALSAADHRAAAEQAAAQGRFAEAVRERLRAVVRELEARGVLDVRPGRTAGEVAADAGRAVPALAADLRSAAVLFDEVWYGGRTADRSTYELLVQVDDRVRAARTVSA